MSSEKSVVYKCVAVAVGVACNVLCNVGMRFLPDVPLFMDTIFTVAVTFIAGLVPGLATGLLSNLMFAYGRNPAELVPGAQIYALCSMASALVVFLYARKHAFGLAIFDLFFLSILVGLANSVLGGIISAFCFRALDKYPTDYIVAGMLMEDIPVLAAAILSRIPINLIDKSIAIAAGYGISLLADRSS